MAPKEGARSAVESLTPLQNTGLGIVCGCIEVVIMQPTLYCKNASQQGLPFSLSPKVLYRGLGVSVLNMGIATGLQFPLTGAVSSLIKLGEDRNLTGGERIAAGLVGGMLSGTVCSPMELTMIQQQRTGRSLAEVPRGVISELGVKGMLRGLSMTSGREGMYTAGYLGIGPVLTGVLQESYGLAAPTAKAAGAIVAGVVAASVSHPMDTIKTCMQGDIQGVKYPNIPATARALYEEGGVSRFCRGWSWRTGRMIGAVFIISETQALLAPVMFPSALDA
eukprot:TRINITY_DN27333_c5_g1_i1.p1 TRINITY_DN27333_c5_g1~~TRINITY_DN27333_c5_g1_i1.p1  ORF type:complete len:306 (+),score=97.69 TRINITY_DN27333_c5_g1_i1:87-920(+)